MRVASRMIERWWLAISAVLVIFASDYQLRQRAPSDALEGSVDYAILVELALYGLVVAYFALTRVRLPRLGSLRTPMYLACIFAMLIAFSLTYTPYPQYAAVRVAQMGVLLLIVLAAATHADRAHFHRFAHAYLALITLSVLYGVVFPTAPMNRLQQGRFTWLAIHPTVSGVLAGLATIVAAAYLLSGRRPRPGPMWPQPVYLTLLAVVGSALLRSHTRGAVAGAVAGIIVLVLASKRGRALIETALVSTALGVTVVLALSAPIVDFFRRDASDEKLASLNSRTDLWEIAMTAFADNPLLGYGVTATQGIFFEQTGLGGGHNAVVNVLVDLGMIGFLVWVALIISVLAGAWKLSSGGGTQLGLDRALLLSGLAFLLVNSVFFEGLGAVTNIASTWLFISVAWLCVAQRAETKAGRLMSSRSVSLRAASGSVLRPQSAASRTESSLRRSGGA